MGVGQVYFEVNRDVEGEVSIVQGLAGGEEVHQEPGGEGAAFVELKGARGGAAGLGDDRSEVGSAMPFDPFLAEENNDVAEVAGVGEHLDSDLDQSLAEGRLESLQCFLAPPLHSPSLKGTKTWPMQKKVEMTAESAAD